VQTEGLADVPKMIVALHHFAKMRLKISVIVDRTYLITLATVLKGNCVTQLYWFARFEVMSAVLLKSTVIPRLTKIIRSGITFVSRNAISL